MLRKNYKTQGLRHVHWSYIKVDSLHSGKNGKTGLMETVEFNVSKAALVKRGGKNSTKTPS